MLLYILVTATLAIVSAAPTSLEARQSLTTGWWGQEFLTYGCKAPIIFVFAKATLEPGNLVSSWALNLAAVPSLTGTLTNMNAVPYAL